MRIAIMGAGGIGCYVGGRLAAAGQDVTFVARGRHLDALRSRGLTVRSPLGDIVLPQVRATDNPAEVGPVDVVLMGVKLYDLETATRAALPMVGPGTMIVPVQNGVTAHERIAAIAGREAVVGGLVFMSSFVVAPGVAEHKSKVHGVVFGELDGSLSKRVEAFRDVGVAAGYDARASTEILVELWNKFILLCGFSAVSALSRQPVGPVLADPELKAVLYQSMAEVAAVARAKGIGVADDVVDKSIAFCGHFKFDSKASMLEDLEVGKPLELEWLSGTLVRLGAELGVPTPFHSIANAMLKPLARGGPRPPA
ncbi:MAG TPA: 2-dehydropantoate 2-reductase [Alphaproteobacteria bacterium]